MQKSAFLTGATGGIGREVASHLAQKGYRLILVDVDAAALTEMADQYPGSQILVLDQRNVLGVTEFCAVEIANLPTPDVVIVNAGMLNIGDVADISDASLLDQLNVNFVSGCLILQAFARKMQQAGKGHIMSTVSMGGIVSLKSSGPYSASKFGLRGFLWALSDELKPAGVHVTGIYPAGVDTPMLRHEAYHGGSALNFLGTPVKAADVARAYLQALEKPKLEVYVPVSEGITGRFAAIWPGLLGRLYPMLEWLGEKGRRKFINRIGREGSPH